MRKYSFRPQFGSILLLFILAVQINLFSQIAPCTFPPPPPNLLTNGNFDNPETCPPPNLTTLLVNAAMNSCIPNWGSANGTPSACFGISSFSAPISACFGVSSDGNGNCTRSEAIFTNFQFCQGVTYQVTFWAQGGAANGVPNTAFSVGLANGITNIPSIPNPPNELGAPCFAFPVGSQSVFQPLAATWTQYTLLIQANGAFNSLVFSAIPNGLGVFESVFLDNITLSVVSPSPVVADFSTSNTDCDPYTVTLNGFAQNNALVTVWEWNFGDGSPVQTGQSVTHTFPGTGPYDVCLRITDGCGASSIIRKTVGPPIYYSVNTTPLTACKGKLGQVRFDVTLSGAPNGSPDDIIPFNLDADIVSPTNAGITISSTLFDANGIANGVEMTKGSTRSLYLDMNIPNTVPVGTIINVALSANPVPLLAACPANNNLTAQLVVTDCGDFTCPCTGPGAINVNGGTLSNSTLFPPGQLNNTCLAIAGQFVIDESYSISGGEIKMQPGASILVKRKQANGAPITVQFSDIDEGGGIHGCGSLWESISVDIGETFNFDGNIISDAENALVLGHQSNVKIIDNLFDNNRWAISVGIVGTGQLIWPYAYVADNLFTSTNLILLDGTRPSGAANVNNGALTLGTYDSPFSSNNIITRLRTGIQAKSSVIGAGGVIMRQFDNVNNPITTGIYSESSMIGVSYSSFETLTKAARHSGPFFTALGNTFTRIKERTLDLNVGIAGIVKNNNNFINNLHEDVMCTGSGHYAIENNYFTANLVSTGNLPAYLTGIGFSNSKSANRSFVRDNIMDYTNGASHTGSAIFVGSSSNIHIYDNLVTPISEGRGVNIVDSDKIRLKGNTFQNQATSASGVESNNSSDVGLCCNIFNSIPSGLYFEGPHGSAKVRNNDFQNCSSALTCMPATILTPQPHAGNLFNGFEAEHFGTLSQKDFSAFLIQDGDLNTPGFQKVPPYWPEQPSDDGFIKPSDSGTAATCQTDTRCDISDFPEGLIGVGEEGAINAADQPTSRGLYDLPMLNFEMQLELLVRMKRNPLLSGQNAVVDSFVLANGSTTLHQLAEIEKNIGQINTIPGNTAYYVQMADSAAYYWNQFRGMDHLYLTDSSATNWNKRKQAWGQLGAFYARAAQAQETNKTAREAQINTLLAQNNVIGTANILEANRKAVNKVHLEVLNSGNNTVTATQAAQLLPIAQQCPIEGGTAVIRARLLYRLYDPSALFNDASCGGSSESEGRPRTANDTRSTNVPTVVLSPNPVSEGRVAVLLPVADDQIKAVNLIAPVGQKWNALHTIGDNQVLLPTLQSGLYYMEITTEHGHRYVATLVVR